MSAPKKFRKKPVTISAMQWDGTAKGATPIINWVLEGDGTASYDSAHLVPGPIGTRGLVMKEACIKIKTLEGTMEAQDGDWIIRGVQNEHYPCKPDIFAATYEEVTA